MLDTVISNLPNLLTAAGVIATLPAAFYAGISAKVARRQAAAAEAALIETHAQSVLANAALDESRTQSRIAVHGHQLEVYKATMDLLAEWRDPAFKESQAYVLEQIPTKLAAGNGSYAKRGYRNLDAVDRAHVTRVSYYFDYLGNLIAAKAVDKQLVLTIIARPIIDHWRTLRPLIYFERKNREYQSEEESVESDFYVERYQGGFEHLYVLAREFRQLSSLPLRSDPAMDQQPPSPRSSGKGWD